MAIVVDNLHSAGRSTAGKCLANPSHTDNTQCFARDRHSEVFQYADLHAATQCAEFAVAFGDAASHIEEQTQRDVGGGGSYRRRSVRNRQAMLHGVGNVDIVVADGVV